MSEKKILIIDDEKVDRMFLKKILKKQGSLEEAEDGESACALFNQAVEAGEPYHLVLLDIGLQGMDGHGVLAKMREFEVQKGIAKEDRTIIIMVTAHTDVRHILKATDGGCDGYLKKPLDKERVFTELSKFGFVQQWEDEPPPFSFR